MAHADTEARVIMPTETGIEWARDRVTRQLSGALQGVDVEREVTITLDEYRHLVGLDTQFICNARIAFVDEGRCRDDAPDTWVAALAYEQMLSQRLLALHRQHGDYYGAADSWVPAKMHRWERATRLLQRSALCEDSRLPALQTHGFLFVDGALSESEVHAARQELERLDSLGQLKPIASQTSVRHDRVGWVGMEAEAGNSGLPGIQLVARLLRAIPAEVESELSTLTDSSWRLTVPTALQAAVYDGSKERPSYYRRHTDATRGARLSRRNPRRLVGARWGSNYRVWPKRALSLLTRARHFSSPSFAHVCTAVQALVRSDCHCLLESWVGQHSRWRGCRLKTTQTPVPARLMS